MDGSVSVYRDSVLKSLTFRPPRRQRADPCDHGRLVWDYTKICLDDYEEYKKELEEKGYTAFHEYVYDECIYADACKEETYYDEYLGMFNIREHDCIKIFADVKLCDKKKRKQATAN